MTREEDLQLLRLEMLRCAQIIDTVAFYADIPIEANGWRSYEWQDEIRHGRAELIKKMHELRRDTVRIEGQLRKINI